MFQQILQDVLSLQNILYVLIGVFGGCIVGAIPGMTSVMLIAISLPFVYSMEPSGAIIMLISICSGANYAGGISAILFNMPGTPSAAATALDGFPMSQKGQGGAALLANIFASFIGGTIAWIIMVLASPVIAKFALMFGPTEYCMLMVWAFTIIGMLAAESPLKGILSGILGLALSTVGLDPHTGNPRYIFGAFELMSGVNTVWASIGIFAFVQIIKFVQTKDRTFTAETTKKAGEKIDWPVKETLQKVLHHPILLIKSTVIGTFIGAAPGAGPAIASFLAYGEAKRSSKNPDEFGKGCIEGVIASEAANNACGFGSLVPMLTLGVPGSTSAALMMTAMMVVGLAPGPELFTRRMDTVYTIFGGGMLSNLAFLIFGLLLARQSTRLLSFKTSWLLPVIVVLASLGVYAPDQAMFGVFFALAIAVFSYVMGKLDFPMTPCLLGIVLGSIMENHFIRAMLITKYNVIKIMFFSPLSIAFTTLTIISVLSIVINHNITLKNKLKLWKKGFRGTR